MNNQQNVSIRFFEMFFLITSPNVGPTLMWVDKKGQRVALITQICIAIGALSEYLKNEL